MGDKVVDPIGEESPPEPSTSTGLSGKMSKRFRGRNTITINADIENVKNDLTVIEDVNY